MRSSPLRGVGSDQGQVLLGEAKASEFKIQWGHGRAPKQRANIANRAQARKPQVRVPKDSRFGGDSRAEVTMIKAAREETFDLTAGLGRFRWGDKFAQIKKDYPQTSTGLTDMFAFEKVAVVDPFMPLIEGVDLYANLSKPDGSQRIWLRAEFDALTPELKDAIQALLSRLQISAYAFALGDEQIFVVGEVEVAVRVEARELSLYISKG